MQKIMFDDKYGLTQAVLEGHKTMTRRIVSQKILDMALNYQKEYYDGTLSSISVENAIYAVTNYERRAKAQFSIGQIVAVAQSYKDAGVSPYFIAEEFEPQVQFTPGWNNKMFVKAWPLPNRIRFTDMKIERLQDISDEDCLKEGIVECIDADDCEHGYSYKGGYWHRTPREAFANLIDKVSGKGTWGSNPYVVAYSFELVQYKKGALK